MRGARRATKPSPVRGALLGLVLDRPGYGYELAGRLEERVGPAWKLARSSVYAMLDGLERDGFVRAERQEMSGRPRQNERVWYHATDEAPAEFARWMARPVGMEPMRPELLAKMAVARPEHVPQLVRALDEYERECLALLREASEDQDADLPFHTWAAVFNDVIAERAEQHLRAELDWVGFARERITHFAADAERG